MFIVVIRLRNNEQRTLSLKRVCWVVGVNPMEELTADSKAKCEQRSRRTMMVWPILRDIPVHLMS